jgi:hypothetical protein
VDASGAVVALLVAPAAALATLTGGLLVGLGGWQVVLLVVLLPSVVLVLVLAGLAAPQAVGGRGPAPAGPTRHDVPSSRLPG